MCKEERRGRAHLAAAAFLLAGIGLSACSSINLKPAGPVTPIAVDAGRAAQLISAYRAGNGLGRVTVDSRLNRAAADYARAMGREDRVSHRIGGSLGRRVTASGYDWGVAAENLAAGQPDLAAALDGWKRSAQHRQNLLSPQVTSIGIAAVATSAGSKNRNYWALILAAPRPEPVRAGPFALGFGR